MSRKRYYQLFWEEKSAYAIFDAHFSLQDNYRWWQTKYHPDWPKKVYFLEISTSTLLRGQTKVAEISPLTSLAIRLFTQAT